MESDVGIIFKLRPWLWANSWWVDLVLLAGMRASEKLLVLILMLDVFPQLLHVKDMSHKLLVSPLTFHNYTPIALLSKTSLRETYTTS